MTTDTTTELREYRVVREIDVEAASYEDAAREAMYLHCNPDSIAHVYVVTLTDRPDATPVEIDLDNQEGT
jgi:hypothetical protein